MEFTSPRALLWGSKLFLGADKTKKTRKKNNGPAAQDASYNGEPTSEQYNFGSTTSSLVSAVPPSSPKVAPMPPEGEPPETSPDTTPKQVWETPPASPRKRFSIKSLLAEAGISMSKSNYVVEVLHPLLEEMVQNAVKQQPEDPALFFLEWLFRRLEERMPETVTKPFSEWLEFVAHLPPGLPLERDSLISTFIALPSAADASVSVLEAASTKGASPAPAAAELVLEVEANEGGEGGEPRRASKVYVVDAEPQSDTQSNTSHKAGPSHSQSWSANRHGSQKARPRSAARMSLMVPGQKAMFNTTPHDQDEEQAMVPIVSEDGQEAPTPKSCLKRGGSRSENDDGSRRGSTTKFAEELEGHLGNTSGDGMDSRRPSFNNPDCNWKARNNATRRSCHWLAMPAVDHAMAMSFVQKVPLFSCLSEEEQAKVANALEIKLFEPDAEVVSLGSKGGAMHFVMSGEASVSVPTVISQLKVGDWFGEQSVLKQHMTSTSCVAASGPLITMCLSSDDLERLNLKRKLQNSQKKQAVGKKAQPTPMQDTPSNGNSRDYRRQKTPAGALLAQVDKELDELDIPKTPQDIQLITDGVRENAQFMDVLQLSEEQIRLFCEEVIHVAVPVDYEIAQEGEISDAFCIVHDGLFEVSEGGKVIGKLRNGESFGELGLLYGAPSRHTIKATRHSIVWKLPIENFRNILKEKSSSRISDYNAMLIKVDAFSLIGEDNQELLVDALEEVFFIRSEEVVVPGMEVDKMYFVYEGQLKVGEGEDMKILSKGDSYGFDLLVEGGPAQEHVSVATETATVLTLDKETVEILLGISISELSQIQDDGKVMADQPSTVSVRLAKARNSLDDLEDNDLADREKQESPSDQDIRVQDRLSRVGVLGAGSFGMVTLEQDDNTGKWYAMKALSKGYVVQQEMKVSIMQEKTLGAIMDCAFVIRTYATFHDDQYLYFLMEPALGGELFELYQDHEDWWGNSTMARFFAAGTSLGLDYMHSKKVIYRDLKLENILLDAKGYPMITDFGLAKVVLGKTYTVCGTPDYMAPEILRRTGHNRGADWWAFGVFLFIMMSGRSPFDAEEAAQIYRNVVKGFKQDHFPDSFSPPLKEVVQTLCRKKPEERLPMGPKGIVHLKSAPWFNHLDWKALSSRTMRSPYTPTVKTAAEYASKSVEAPPVVAYEDDGTGWDAEFASQTALPK